jgi:hypothetical protein
MSDVAVLVISSYTAAVPESRNSFLGPFIPDALSSTEVLAGDNFSIDHDVSPVDSWCFVRMRAISKLQPFSLSTMVTLRAKSFTTV